MLDKSVVKTVVISICAFNSVMKQEIVMISQPKDL